MWRWMNESDRGFCALLRVECFIQLRVTDAAGLLGVAWGCSGLLGVARSGRCHGINYRVIVFCYGNAMKR